MHDRVKVHERVAERHPDLISDDVIHAWHNAIAVICRNYSLPDVYAAAGPDSRGRMLEMLGVELEDGTMLVYHAMKLSSKMKKELGLG